MGPKAFAFIGAGLVLLFIVVGVVIVARRIANPDGRPPAARKARRRKR
jgi:hypothetical protein